MGVERGWHVLMVPKALLINESSLICIFIYFSPYALISPLYWYSFPVIILYISPLFWNIKKYI